MHMEKSKQEEDQKRFSKGRSSSSSWSTNKSLWDCGSTLYDSYELHSFKRQINSAIATSPRTLSMPHLTHRRSRSDQPPPPPPPSSSSSNNKSFKISRTFQKLLRFVFNKSSSSNNSDGQKKKLVMGDLEENKYWKERLYVVYDKYDAEAVLSTIPELPEFEMGGLSPEKISSLVRKSASARFTTPTPIPISCA